MTSMPMSRRRSPGTTTYDTAEIATSTSTAAGSRRRMRRPTNRVHEIDPLQERRDHLPELHEHQVRVLAHLGERVRAHPDQHLLVGLAVAVAEDDDRALVGVEVPKGRENPRPVFMEYDAVGGGLFPALFEAGLVSGG